MSVLKQILCTCAAAALLAAAIPNEYLSNGSFLLGSIALFPFYVALRYAKSSAYAGFLGGLFTGIAHVLSSFWLASFHDFAVLTLGASAGATFVLGIFWGKIFYKSLQGSTRLRPVVFAALYVCWEWTKSTGFLGYPWGTLPMTVHAVPELMQIADVTGTYGVTFLLAIFSAVIAEIILAAMNGNLKLEFSRVAESPVAANILFVLALFVLALTYGVVKLHETVIPQTSFDVALIQNNADSWNGSANEAIQTAQNLTRCALATSPHKPDLVTWSETLLTRPFLEHKQYYRRNPVHDPFVPFLKEIGVPLLTGCPMLMSTEPFKICNSALLLTPSGDVVDFYAKRQLVPFAEYIPMIDHPWMQRFMDKIAGFSSSWTPGMDATVFSIENKHHQTVRFSTPICFEDAFPWVCRTQTLEGCDLFINITNDSWSQTDSAEIQHVTLAAYRAIEFRKPMVRSTASGVTCIIDGAGVVTQQLPLFEENFLRASVPVYPYVQTVYCRLGEWFPVLCFIIAVAFFVAYQLHDRRE